VSTPALLDGQGLTVCHHAGEASEIRALEGVSVTVTRGAFVAVAGPSGSGKTTLLSVLGLLRRPTSGSVLVEGRDAGEASEAERSRLRRSMGFVLQGAPMLRGLPLWDNVTHGLVPRGETRAHRHDVAETLLRRVRLGSKMDVPPEELSAGERQRAGLARALAGSPAAILADEPTSNLDRASAETIVAVLREFHAQGGTLVVASHDPLALAEASSTFVLEAGRVVNG
jgi:putative ABC transport system ATP-binding protein